MPPRALYLHVPFCVRRCAYCDFAVEAVREPPVEEWIQSIARELALTVAEQGWAGPLRLDTLYIGGGTPSLLGASAMGKLLEALAPFVLLDPGIEWTCEANPESFTPKVARAWRDAGVNRLSLGAQTFHPEALRWMGRLHGADGPGRAMQTAREAGFDNVSIDLIFGLPARLGRDWAADLDRTLSLNPEHVSLYGLTAEPGTPLGRWVGEKREVLADEDRYAEEYLLANERLVAAGFEDYEVSNFARPGRRSRHNLAYWTGAAYAACGPGAHAFLPPVRRWNVRSWSAYREALAAGRLPIEGSETIDENARALEEVWLGLRTDFGLALSALSPAAEALAGRWSEHGFTRILEGRVKLSPRGWLLLDRLAFELDNANRATPDPARSGRAIDGGAKLVQISANSNHLVR